MNTKLPPRMRHKFKLRNNRLQESSVELDEEIQLMSNNLLKVQRELTEEEEHEPYSDVEMKNEERNEEGKRLLEENKQIRHAQQQQHAYDQQTQQQIPQLSKQTLKQKYKQYLSKNKFSSNYEQKINQLLDYDQENMSIGNTIALFEMVYYFREILTHDVLHEIQTKAFEKFVRVCQEEMTGEQKNEGVDQVFKPNSQTLLLKTCLSQLIAICGIANQQTIEFFTQYMLQHPQEFPLSYKLLINLNYSSILTLIKILNEDLQQFTPSLMHHLANTQFIVQKILLPNIVNDLTNSTISSREKNIALTVLTRLGELINCEKLTQTLVSLFKSNTIDKKLLISAIKATGKQQGQRILINLLHQPNLNQDISIFIIKCLSQNHSNIKPLPQIVVCDYPINNLFQMNKLYFYQLTMSKEQQITKDIIYFNPRIFSSSLEKLSVSLQHTVQKTDDCPINQLQCPQMFILRNVIGGDQEQTLPNLEIINLLMSFIDKSYKKSKIKQAAIEALGNIVLPQNPSDIIQKLIICLNTTTDPAIISSTCLTLSKIPFHPSTKLVNKLSELLRNNYWKVRISACQTIANLLRLPVQSVIQTLIKCLKDGSINRQLVCQTMIKIHPVCEQILIEILKDSKDSKIQQIILCSFNQPQILESQHLPTILQTIFDFSNNKRKQLRYISIGVVNSLRKHAQQLQKDISYFKPKNLIPFYYGFLDDLCVEIRDLALGLILEFGSYAELVLIQGMTKGRVNCKIQCAKGLGLRGIQNFRALLLGMRDLSERVRLECCQAILNNFQIGDIVNEYKEKSSQCISLIYNIKDLLNGNTLSHQAIKYFLKQLIQKLSYEANIEFEAYQEENQEELIQKEINEFRQSIKMRKNQLKEEDEKEQSVNSENDQNKDPNVCGMFDNRDNKGLKTQSTKVNKLKQESNAEMGKRYYFKLNETIL